ncbi:MAG TPA: type II toxin-antitoxin system VapB family antitoxin [Methylocystis sp.]|nr:type II toxin-antitoxin system VapB family antitoxin [Methylocystis sp.]
MFTIRDPRAAQLARELAAKRRTTMTAAVIGALESELRRESEKRPLADRLRDIAQRAAAMAGPHRRELTKDEIDALWSQ